MINKQNLEKYLKPYEHKDFEQYIYQTELNSGFFNPDNLNSSEFVNKWSTATPPPNANGKLHVGHALDIFIKDIIGRHKRQTGHKVLMIPGTDHAGFETQVVYEKKLEKEGRTRFGMNRDDLYKEIFDFTLQNKVNVENDVKKIGASYDFGRQVFTLDNDIVEYVQNTFIQMYKDNLIYRDKRDVNWCSKHQTSLSDVETASKEYIDTFYTLKVGDFNIATVRPETKFADEYIVMHTNDERYKAYKHGDTFEAEWLLGKQRFTIIKDDCIDMEFGTGVMTITPWHSNIDFEIAKRHNLNMKMLIDEYGKFTDEAGPYKGLKAITDGRKKAIEIFEQKGLIVKKEEGYKHNIPVCYKCENPIEPMLKDQWFVRMNSLCESAYKASIDGEIKFVSEQFKKTYEHWMQNPIDWNISRQIVWGIRIPAWFKNKGQSDETYIIQKEAPDDSYEQDIDTFDTWFSSGQWPLLTLKRDDFDKYYPTDFMETGRDLIFKWVPRMIIFGLYKTGKVPFKDIYMHGMTLDSKGQKMSKSKGNVMSPIEVGDEYGMDSLRMAMILGSAPGADINMSIEKIKGQKKFINKLWNITRFVFENTLKYEIENIEDIKYNFLSEHKNRFDIIKDKIIKNINNYNIHISAEDIYHYVWHDFADIVIEDYKKIDENDKVEATKELHKLFREIITLIHPFMPFVTETIWQDIIKDKNTKSLVLIEQIR